MVFGIIHNSNKPGLLFYIVAGKNGLVNNFITSFWFTVKYNIHISIQDVNIRLQKIK